MKIAALQMVSTPDVARNLDAAARLIGEAAGAGAQIVGLPEYFCFMGHRDEDKLALVEDPVASGAGAFHAGPIQRFLGEVARQHGVWVIGGTLPLRVPGDANHAHNTTCVFAPDGTLAASYHKIHLFRYDSGCERYDESRVLAAGRSPAVFEVPAPTGVPDTKPLRVGLSVCYDLRFPELYRQLMRPPCDLIAVPSAFTYATGQAHWELLLRARAVENQCYVIAPAQGGQHENGRRTYGHSLVVDPWGTVLACRDEGEGVVLAELDLERLAMVRRQLPALDHRVIC